MDTSEQQLTRTASTILVNQVISFFILFLTIVIPTQYGNNSPRWNTSKDVCCIASFMSLENMHEPSNIFTVLLVNK